ncbi:autotransporter outer membrane beta-barrel domain-containing protein [Comamonas sp. B21-038]|uniref:autotransporter outer membrane beta-barrel domain-containing protein n=1 Tax=Comamonas sp. B21-038 TaxID=2918299 RepID=UPI001EFB7629|nr:autotransporter outer membrane beta-barrel domain-containing protein [Comamonas sp. B21-038]ULR90267.1 autotransporter outer membrane beta-barrel domain-containing protein [Comamonas sp. B21-038]
MRNYLFTPTPILLACWLMAGSANAQSAHFTGDTVPTGDFRGGQDFNAKVFIGDLGEGSLDIVSDTFSNRRQASEIARSAGSTGTVNVSSGGQWNTGPLYVGRAGTAVFNVTNGGKITSDHTFLGQLMGGVGIATVDGPGSAWSIPPESNSDFWIGSGGGAGTLRILNGGTVSTSSDIYTSYDLGSSSTIDIDGANSSLSANAWCYFGMAAPSHITITNGGQLNCNRNTYLAWGSVSLSGIGSKWKVNTHLDIGRSQIPTKGTLSVGEGSTVELAGNLRLAADSNNRGGSGTLNIEGSRAPGVLLTQNVLFGVSGYNTINFKHTDSTGNYQFSPSISGGGNVNILGTGTTVMMGNNAYTGHTSIQAGVLRAGSATALSSTSGYSISPRGTLDINRHSSTLYNLTNAGNLIIGAGDTNATVTTTYDYSGLASTIHMNAALGGNNSPTQKLIVNRSTNGSSTLNIRNLGGTGAQTTGNGILVVQVGWESNGQFTLPAPGYIQAGAYRYTLHKVGRNWYLQSAPANAKAAAADDSAACIADPLAQGCALAAGQGAVAKAQPAALKAGTANAAAAAEAAAPAADASAQLEATLGADDLKDDGAVGFAGAVPVPGLGMVGMVSLSSLIGVAGLRRGRKAV